MLGTQPNFSRMCSSGNPKLCKQSKICKLNVWKQSLFLGGWEGKRTGVRVAKVAHQDLEKGTGITAGAGG